MCLFVHNKVGENNTRWAFSLVSVNFSSLPRCCSQFHSHSTMPPPPPSPSCTVAGGAVGGSEDPSEGIVIPPEYLRWLLDDDDDGFLYRATMDDVEAEAASLRLRAAAAPSSHPPMQRQPSSPSCTADGGGAGGDEDPFYDSMIPAEYLKWLMIDDDACFYGAAAMGVEAAEAEDERRRLAEAPAGGHSPMHQPSLSSPSCSVAGEAGGDEDPFDDIVVPPDGLLGDDDDDGSLNGAEAEGERRLADQAQAGGDGGHVEDRLSMTYRGHMHVFESVPQHKVIDHGDS